MKTFSNRAETDAGMLEEKKKNEKDGYFAPVQKICS